MEVCAARLVLFYERGRPRQLLDGLLARRNITVANALIASHGPPRAQNTTHYQLLTTSY